MSNHRMQRVESVIMEELSKMLLRGMIKDPRVNSLLSITRIEVAKDISHARVFISSLEGEKKTDKGVEGLQSAAGYIQGVLGKKLSFRLTPKLSFVADHGIEEGFRMNKLIEDLNK